jgi:hypothetical protein
VAGAGIGKPLPIIQIQTRGAHQSALDKPADPTPDHSERAALR